MFQIVRIVYKGETELHSIEERATRREALARFHAILAADLTNNEVTYCYAGILNDEGKNAIEPFMFNANANEYGVAPNPFNYAVLRVRVKDGQRSTSVEYKSYDEAIKRYFAILAADLNDETVTYNMCTIVDSNGYIIEARSFS